MSHLNRRHFIQTASALALSAGVSPPLLAYPGSRAELVPAVDDPRLRELTDRALDSARQAGASYADVRLTYIRERTFTGEIKTSETLAAGVRALVDGYWGFASSPVWHRDEMVRLGRDAVALAHTGKAAPIRRVDLAAVDAPAQGHWTMPVRTDPFDIPLAEITDFMRALTLYTSLHDAEMKRLQFEFSRQEKVFASTDGSYCTQRLYRTGGSGSIEVTTGNGRLEKMMPGMTHAGAGWEYFSEAPLKERILRTIDEIRADLALPVRPIEVGRYPLVLDAASVALLASRTIGIATELDRAMGYEANAGGTSYLNRPLEMLGTFRVGAPLLNVSANRNDPGAVATVHWDDEGVTPASFLLVRDGTLAGMQTTRESASWIAGEHSRNGTPVRSHGCAVAGSGLDAPLVQPPNLSIVPAEGEQGFDGLLGTMRRGIAIRHMQANIDFQQSGGIGSGVAYEIINGKRSALYADAGLLFRSSELWHSIQALGGPASQERIGLQTEKGEPPQNHYHSVTAVPAAFGELSIVDIRRKA